MNVPEVSEFSPALRSILRHFQLCRRKAAMLNDAMEGLDGKTFTWCPMNVLHFENM